MSRENTSVPVSPEVPTTGSVTPVQSAWIDRPGKPLAGDYYQLARHMLIERAEAAEPSEIVTAAIWKVVALMEHVDFTDGILVSRSLIADLFSPSQYGFKSDVLANVNPYNFYRAPESSLRALYAYACDQESKADLHDVVQLLYSVIATSHAERKFHECIVPAHVMKIDVMTPRLARYFTRPEARIMTYTTFPAQTHVMAIKASRWTQPVSDRGASNPPAQARSLYAEDSSPETFKGTIRVMNRYTLAAVLKTKAFEFLAKVSVLPLPDNGNKAVSPEAVIILW